MFFIFDTETSGLMHFTESRGYYHPRQLDKYDTSRVVQISWIILDAHLQEIERNTYIIKPDGWVMTQENIDIHKISNEKAHAEGIPFSELADIIRSKTAFIKVLVAHNVAFDDHVLQSEFYRYAHDDLAVIFSRARKFCTMKEAKKLYLLPKNPKLAELYEMLYHERMENAHDAEYDTMYCMKCFISMKNAPLPDPQAVLEHKNYLRQKYSKRKSDEEQFANKRPLFFLTEERSN